MNRIEDSVEVGWRLRTVDASIPDRTSVTLERDVKGKRKWLALSEQQQEETTFVVWGVGTHLLDAISAANTKAREEGDLPDVAYTASTGLEGE